MTTDQDKARAVISEFLQRPTRAPRDGRTRPGLWGDGLGLDSLEAAELSAMLEDEFGSDPFSAGGDLPERVGDVVGVLRGRPDQNDPSARSRGDGRRPSGTAVVTPEGAPTYGELLDAACRVAGALRRRDITRFAIAEPDAAWVIRAAGRRGAGRRRAVPVPARHRRGGAAPTRPARSDTTCDRDPARPDHRRHARVGPPAGAPRGAGGRGAGAALRTAAQPLMIRTTGTTGLPKAARHDWRVLAQTVAGVRPRPDQRWLLAYGPHQFAGVQVLLHVLASQATLVAPFPRQPRDGLDALLAQDVTCVSCHPDVLALPARRGPQPQGPAARAWSRSRSVARRARPTSSRSSAPPSPTPSVSQVYASTEFGSITSVRDGLPGLAVDALCSESNPTSNVRVDDGELWVRAAAGHARLRGRARDGDDGGAAAPGEWRRTGDLVEIVDDRVMFRGRKSEVINVGGVKVHPLPVEDRITGLDCVAAARVFGRPNKLTGAIVAARSCRWAASTGADVDAIRAEIKDAVADLPRAWQPRSVTFVDAIETKGGKTVPRDGGLMAEATLAPRSRSSPAAARAWAPGSCRPSSTPATASRRARARRPTGAGLGGRPRAQGTLPLQHGRRLGRRRTRSASSRRPPSAGAASTSWSTTPASPAKASSGCSATTTLDTSST